MKKISINCNVIADLMPLYKENICSEESKVLIEEHIRNCEECRQLSEGLEIPLLKPYSQPSEAETFRKAGKKLRKSTFTKIMSVITAVLLAVFGVWNVSWYFIAYRPYQKLLDCSSPFEKTFENIHSYNDGTYIYEVHMPKYLEFSSGFVNVHPSDRIVTDKNGTVISFKEEYVILFVWLKKGGAKYGIDIITGDHGEQFYIDKEVQTYNKTLEKHYDEIRGIMDAVLNLWGDKL